MDIAHENGKLGAHFRTVYGMEAARILTHRNQLDIEMIVQSWRENKDIYGIEEAYSFNGRYKHRRSSSRERGLSKLIVFSEQSRLMDTDLEKDMYIAALEGAFWVSTTKADVFTPYLEHSDKEIRLTAKRILSHFHTK